MAEVKMTKREFAQAIVAIFETEEAAATAQELGFEAEVLVAMAIADLEKLDEANAKRCAATAKKAEENAPLADSILAILPEDKAVTATEIAGEVGLSTQKVTYLCKNILVAQGLVELSELKVNGRKVNGYRKIVAEA